MFFLVFSGHFQSDLFPKGSKVILWYVQDFGMGSVRAGVSWVCAKHVFRKYLGNEERSEDEVDGGLIKVTILKGNTYVYNEGVK